jgi:2-hydroxychromene-2-carboxylate isomerase
VTATTFYFDLASPYSYLGAERVDGLFEDAGLERPTWCPILFGALLKGLERKPWGLTDERERHVAIIEARAATYGLPPLVWPEPSPANSLAVMRAATVADSLDQVRPFVLAAYRAAFAEGRDLGDPEVIAAVADAVGLRAEIEAGIAAPETKARLRAATEEAADAGLEGIPTVAVGPDLFWGDDRLEEAVAAAAR